MDPDQEPNDDPEPDEDEPCERAGSIIECENQVLGERIAVPGTPYFLNYRSDRVPGRLVSYAFKVRLSGPTVPSSLKRIELIVDVAGRRSHLRFSPAPNLRYTFVWDGLDAYGRAVAGPVRATARVGYVYPGVYYEPGDFRASFGRFSTSARVVASRQTSEVFIWRSAQKSIGGWDARGEALGGWTLSSHHVYDADSGVLYSGDGRSITGTSLGNGRVFSGALPHANGEVVEWIPDGTVYTVEMGYSIDLIWEHRPNEPPRFRESSDPYKRIRDVAASPDGTLYYTTTGCTASNPSYVRRVKPNSWPYSEAEVLMTWPEVQCPQSLEIAPDGSLLILDNDRILRRSPSGDVTVLTDQNRGGFVLFTARLVLAPDGSIYFSEPSLARVRRLAPDGSISTVAGTGERGFSGDGGPATTAQLRYPTGLALDRSGGLIIADSGNHRLRRISAGGIIETLAGSGVSLPSPTFPIGTPAVSAVISNPEDVAVAADGTILTSTASSVFKIRPPLPSWENAGYALAARDGERVFTFDASGRHLRTLSAVTGASLLEFEYDAGGRLTAIRDRDGNTTRIERDAYGRALRIVAPGGVATELEMNAAWYLSQMTGPDGALARFDYGPKGLLSRLGLPGDRVQSFAYSGLGRLL